MIPFCGFNVARGGDELTKGLLKSLISLAGTVGFCVARGLGMELDTMPSPKRLYVCTVGLAGLMGELDSSIGSVATPGFEPLGGDDGIARGRAAVGAARFDGLPTAGRSSESSDNRRLLVGLLSRNSCSSSIPSPPKSPVISKSSESKKNSSRGALVTVTDRVGAELSGIRSTDWYDSSSAEKSHFCVRARKLVVGGLGGSLGLGRGCSGSGLESKLITSGAMVEARQQAIRS